MSLTIGSIFDEEFKEYGQIVTGYDLSEFMERLSQTPMPEEGVVYVPAEQNLEQLPLFDELSSTYYGGMPIQIGYCNGKNTMLNCLEYHRDSEVDICGDDIVLLLAKQSEIVDGQLDTSKVKAFLAPKGTAVELYGTTLHYAPCSLQSCGEFRTAIILPKGTNYNKPEITIHNNEDKTLWAANKWLLAHKDSSEAADGAHIGLIGENINIAQ